jgi:hypothetical protein
MKFLFSVVCYFLLNNLQIQGSVAPSSFIRNEGQWPSGYQFRAQNGSHRIWLGEQQIFYQLRRADLHPLSQLHSTRFGEATDTSSVIGHDYRVKFLNSRPVKPQANSQPSPTRYNFFLGNRTYHRSSVQAFEEVVYNDLYEGTDLRLKGGDNFLKYDFELDPGRDGSEINMNFDGVSGLELSGGRLRIKTAIGTLEEHIPKAWQLVDGTAREIACEYILKGTVVGFRFPKSPDPRYKTVIDPLLIFFTYSGAIDDNWANTAVSDSRGNSYTAGTIYGSSFPTTPGVIDRSFNGQPGQDPYLSYDIGLLKFDSTGSQLLYCTFIGGSGAETPHSLTTDQDDNLLILGSTASPDFPVSSNAFQTGFRGGPEEYPFGFGQSSTLPTYVLGSDLFVTKIKKDGSQILASTYLGGNGTDGIMTVYETLVTNYGDQFRSDVVCAGDGSVFIASHSHSLNFPTVSAYRNFRSGPLDGVVARLSPDLSTLIWSTYFGGSAEDAFFSLKILPGNRVAVCGGTNSSDMPVRQGAWQDSHGGGIDGMIAVFEQNAGTYLGSTYSGTSSYDQTYLIETDPEGNIYTFGQTMGVMPRTTAFGDDEGGNYLQKYNGELSVLQWSCTFGKKRRQPNLVPTGLMLDSCGRIFLAGWGGVVNYDGPGFAGGVTSGLPVTNDAIKPVSGDSSDFYFLVLSKNAGSVVYGTYLGANSQRGEHVDGGTSRFNRNGVITQAICGCRDRAGDYFRGTINAHERDIRSGNCNNGVMKLNLFDLVADMDWAGTLKCPATLTLTNNSQNGETYIWNMGNGDSIVSNERIIQYVYENPGKYWLSIRALNPKTCKLVSIDGDSILIPDPFPFPNFSAADSFCAGDTLRPAFPQISGYPVWWEPQNFLSDPSSPSPTIIPLGSILYNINIRNEEGCVRKIPYELRNRKLRLDIGTEKDFRPCEGITTVRFFSRRDSSDFYLWDFGNGETSSGPEVIRQFPGSGNFPVRLSGGKGSCLENAFDTLRLNNEKVSIMPDFDAQFLYDDCSQPRVILKNKTLNALGYEWDFGDGNKSTEPEPVYKYENPGVYRIVLRAFKDGCIESASDEVKVQEVLVPNLITFNQDGKNETLQIRGAQSNWGLDIYNRWGLPVFSTDSYQNNWKPENLEEGIYFFTIRFPEGGYCRNWFMVSGPE